MIEHLRRLVSQHPTPTAPVNVAREYLQARILEALQACGAFTRWAFVGGTALRFLFDLPRFSEDLDFSLFEPGLAVGLRETLPEVARTLALEGYEVGTTAKEGAAVAAAQVQFGGLLHDLGLSPHRGQKLTIRIEIDTNPPAGAVIMTTLVRRHVLLHLCHHDQASLLAGKLHAILSRSWTKGRDLYDLAWYLSDRRWPAPNLVLLNAALRQTGWDGGELTVDHWREAVQRRLAQFDWDQARRDVQPFLERADELQYVTLEALDALLCHP